jgi:hypothetical protein
MLFLSFKEASLKEYVLNRTHPLNELYRDMNDSLPQLQNFSTTVKLGVQECNSTGLTEETVECQIELFPALNTKRNQIIQEFEDQRQDFQNLLFRADLDIRVEIDNIKSDLSKFFNSVKDDFVDCVSELVGEQVDHSDYY